MALSLTGVTATLAQLSYGQPGYSQPGYNQPYNTQPGYGQPGYNQPDYNQPYYGQSGGPGAYQDFYDQLSPYGQWVQTPEYGAVWIPNAEPNFQPYATNGHWVVTEYGNTWVSDYAWGWAPFHYGRWYQDRYRGWAWVPGNDWGPAWVSWRSGGGYYGWAPLGPGATINVNVNMPLNYWVFVPQVYITNPNIYSYCIPGRRMGNIYQNTVYVNNVYRVNNRVYAYGPRREEIEYVTRRSVPVYRIEPSGRPGRSVVMGNSVGIYRPEMNRGGYGNRYDTDQRDYQRQHDYPSNRGYGSNSGYGNTGNYGGNSRSGQASGNQWYPQQGQYQPQGQYPQQGRQESNSGDRGRNSRYERELQQAQSAPQPAPTYSQPSQPTPQPAQAYPQQGQQEAVPQGNQPRGWGHRQESVPQTQENSQPATSQPQEPRSTGYGQPPGMYPGRGSSRGPR